MREFLLTDMKELKKIVDFPGGITISSDPRNWVLSFGSKNDRQYFSTLEDMLEHLIEIRLKTTPIKAKQAKFEIKNLLEIVLAVKELCRDDLAELKKTVTKADMRLRSDDLGGGGHG